MTHGDGPGVQRGTHGTEPVICRPRGAMRISDIRSLAGPNVWSRNQVLEVWLAPEDVAPAGPDSIGAGKDHPGDDEAWQNRLRRVQEWWATACAGQLGIPSQFARWAEELRRSKNGTDVLRCLALGV